MTAAMTRRQLREAGFDERQADALVGAFEAEARPQPDLSGLKWGAGLCFAVLIAAMGWLLSETRLNQQRIEANRDRIDGIASQISHTNERLARIETLLQERLPERQ